MITCAPNFPEGKLFPGYQNRWHQVEELSGIRVVRVKTYMTANAGTYRRILDFLSFMASGFVAGLFESRPDVVAATSPQFFAGVGGCLLAAVRRVPFVLELADLWPESVVAVGAMRRSAALRWLEQVELWMYRRAARIVALTEAFRTNLVQRGVEPGKIGVVVNGVDLARYRPMPKDMELARRWGIPADCFVVGYLGTLEMAHGLENVLSAAALDRGGKLRFLFVGPGAERDKLMREAARRRLDNVLFVPAQPKESMPSWWSLCDVALVHLRNTPLFETVIPSKMFEAMGMGKPIVLAAPKGQASAILAESGAGLWVPAEDPRALLEAVTLLSGNRPLYQRLARQSLASAPRYSRERQARDMLAILEQALPAPAPPRVAAAG